MLICVGTKNPSKLFSVQGAYGEYHPNARYTVAVFGKAMGGEDQQTPILGDLIRVLPVPGQSESPDQSAPHHIVIGIEVDSGVSAQPFSAEETLLGARNRAQAIRSIVQATPTDVLQKQLQQLDSALSADSIDVSQQFFVGVEGGIEKVLDKWLESGYIVIQNGKGVECVGTSARFELANFVIEELQTGIELCHVVDRLSNQTDVRSSQGYMGMITNTLLDRARAYKHGVLFAISKFEGPPQYWDAADRQQ